MINSSCKVLKSSGDNILKSSDDKILTQCAPPATCEDFGSATFDVQIRLHGSVEFHHCGPPDTPPNCTEVVDTQSLDYTLNLTDLGNGVAQFPDAPVTIFSCPGNIFFDARLICCTPPIPGFPCSICWQDDYVWQIRLFINAFFCNNYTPIEDCEPPDSGTAVTQLAVNDTNCMFNATYGLIQLAITPFPNGTYTGSTSMTEQGGIGSPCDSRGPVGGGGANFGDVVIDWQATISP